MKIPRSVVLLLTSVATAIFGLTACGSSGPSISIAISAAPPGTLPVNAQTLIAATTTNDSSNSGVDWSVTCGSSGTCGSFNPAHTVSGATTIFTAPFATPSGSAVTITAKSAKDSSKSKSAMVTITQFSNATLNGNFVFSFSGLESSAGAIYSVDGVFAADGSGTITAGEQDFRDPSTSAFNTLTGTYSIGADGRGTITLITGNPSIGVSGTMTLGVVIVSGGSHAMITEFDSFGSARGTMDPQTLTAFSSSTLSQGFAFTMLGQDFGTNPLTWGGVLNVDSPCVISGRGSVTDEDDTGFVNLSQTASGTVSAPDSSGRVIFSLTLQFVTTGPVTMTGYIVDATHVKLIETDALLGVTGGTAIGQGSKTGTFSSNSAVFGNLVFSAAGQSVPGPTVAAGILTADGNGNITRGTVDVNAAGNPATASVTGTYAVDAAGTGRGVVTLAGNATGLTTYAFYLVGSGSPSPILNLDVPSLAAGMAFQQSNGPFSATSLQGSYGMGFSVQFTTTFGSDVTGQMSADGTGTLAGTEDINESSAGLSFPSIPFTGSFTGNAAGQFSGSFNSSVTGPISVDFFLISSTQAVLIETDNFQPVMGEIDSQ
ncbi:MAG TPA: hypothetical protein VGT03_10475 [Candidatus Acidoferrales bacterium]|nr:hypothetical protein [Candidatus Acidoferrales bacterium]